MIDLTNPEPHEDDNLEATLTSIQEQLVEAERALSKMIKGKSTRPALEEQSQHVYLLHNLEQYCCMRIDEEENQK